MMKGRIAVALLAVIVSLGVGTPAHAGGTHKKVSFDQYVANLPVRSPWAISAYSMYAGTGDGDYLGVGNEVQPFQSSCLLDPLPRATDGSVDVISGDGILRNPQSRNNRCYYPQNEPTIAVNPTNPKNLIAGANDYRHANAGEAYVSSNGGATWSNIRLPGVRVGGDPVVAFSDTGVAYYVNLYFDDAQNTALLLSRSTDGGYHWGRATGVNGTFGAYDRGIFNDKPWLAVDHLGRVYVTWTQFRFGWNGYLSSAIKLVRSSDGGRTWGSVHTVDLRHPYAQGSQIAFAPDNTAYISFAAASPLLNLEHDTIVLGRSTDGLHYTTQELGQVYDDLNCYPVSWTTYREHLSGYQFRLASFPSMAVDSTGAYVAWADDKGAKGCGTNIQTYPDLALFAGQQTRGRIVVASVGKGISVRTYLRGEAAYPTVARVNNRTYVSYYRPDGSGSVCAPDGATAGRGCVGVFLTDGRRTVRLAGPSNTYTQFGGEFIGDYMGLSAGRDKILHAVWTDSRGTPQGRNQDIYTRSVATPFKPVYRFPWNRMFGLAFIVLVVGVALAFIRYSRQN